MTVEQLATIERFLASDVAPIAGALDHDTALLARAFKKFSHLDTLRLFVPKTQGGRGADRQALISYNMLLAGYSGALLFLQAQHQYAVMALAKYPITPTVEGLFQAVIGQQKAIGICTKKDSVKAVKNETGC